MPLGATLGRKLRMWPPPSPVSLQGGKLHSRRTIIPYQGVPRNPCAVHIAIYIAWQPRRTPTEAAGRRGAGHLVHENCRICFRPVSFYESSDRVESTLRNPPSPSFPFPCSPPAHTQCLSPSRLRVVRRHFGRVQEPTQDYEGSCGAGNSHV